MHNFDDIIITDNEIFKSFKVISLNYQAKISELFKIEAKLFSNFSVLKENSDNILQQNITFRVEYGTSKKFYCGMISEIKQEIVLNKLNQSQTIIYLIILPCLYTLKLTNGYRSFSEKKSSDVIDFFMKHLEKEFKNFNALSNNIYKKDLLIKKINIVQYGESDFDFFMRILQQEQICFYFNHSEKGYEIIFTDDLNQSFQDNKELNTQELNLKVMLEKEKYDSDVIKQGYLSDQAYNYKKTDEFTNRNIRFFDYDFRNFPLVSETSLQEEDKSSWHSNMNLFKKSVEPLAPSSGELTQQDKKINYISNAEPKFIEFETHNHSPVIGSRLTLDLDPLMTFKEQEKTRLYEIEETYTIKANKERLGFRKIKSFLDLGKYTYSIQKFTNIKQQVHFPCTAIVFGENIGDIAEIDSSMLIKISFFWHNSQTSSLSDKGPTSHYVKARLGQMLAGAGRGSLIIPRIGDEVIVCFENGDPELPMIIGSLYNKKNYTPNQIPDEAEINIFRTSPSENNSNHIFNEMIFDERKNKELISFQAKKDLAFTTEEKTLLKTKNFETEVIENTKYTTKNYEFNITEKGKLTVSNGDFIIDIENSNITISAKKNITIKAAKVEIKGSQGSMVID